MKQPQKQGFTLVELLVGVGVIATLVGMLMPALNRARSTARITQCASNLHQIVIAFSEYAAVSKGNFPPNISSPAPGQLWYDDDRIAHFLPVSHPPVPLGKQGGGAYLCPEDLNPAYLSYSMNVWASSAADSSITSPTPPAVATGSLFSSRTGQSSKLILLAESFSGTGSATGGWFATATIGATGASAAAKFGALGGLAPPFNAKRFGNVTSELNFMRHRLPNTRGKYTQPRGRLNIAYADGHVSAKTDADLVNANGNLTGDTYWSPLDWNGQ